MASNMISLGAYDDAGAFDCITDMDIHAPSSSLSNVIEFNSVGRGPSVAQSIGLRLGM